MFIVKRLIGSIYFNTQILCFLPAFKFLPVPLGVILLAYTPDIAFLMTAPLDCDPTLFSWPFKCVTELFRWEE